MSEYNLDQARENASHIARHGLVDTVHHLEPDFHRAGLEIPAATQERMLGRLQALYGYEAGRACWPELERVLRVYWAHKPQHLIERDRCLEPGERFTQEDVILITYGDLVQEDNQKPLDTLVKLCDTLLPGINTFHILPFFPYSSDRGFSVIDFEQVDPNLGNWEDIEQLDARVQLMFDAVFNHVSAKSRYFQEFLNGHPDYQDLFIAYRSRDELTPEQRELIRRPRTSDILTEFQSIDGPVHVWTTFSPDQVDLNFKSPVVLTRIVELLLLYVRKGADIVRLDAVTYLWTEPGTSCASLDETHEIIKLFRDILNLVAPGVALITETNVPHEENISYFGNGHDEAHLVYNFALPPLVLHTFYTGDSTAISNWADSLETPSDTTHFFNFLDSHDGFGLMGVRNLLPKEDIERIVERASHHGGRISYKTDREGGESPYEINITLWSALNDDSSGESLELQVKRLLAARSISIVLKGVPAAYLLGLIGKRNDIKALEAAESNRAINRTILDFDLLLSSFNDPENKLYRMRELARALMIRKKHRAFHPRGPQKVLRVSPAVFALLRTSPEGDETVLALTNISERDLTIEVPLADLDRGERRWHDLLSHREILGVGNGLRVDLEAYAVAWLVPAR